MRFTKWRVLAEGSRYNADVLDHDGPAVYELATVGPRGGEVRVRYVGESGNERERMRQYGSGQSHLESRIALALKRGEKLLYRASARRSKASAVKAQCNLLAKYDHEWNSRGCG